MKTTLMVIVLSGVVVDQILARHPVVLRDGDAAVDGSEVVPGHSAYLVTDGAIVSLALPLAASGVIAMAVYSALHIAWAMTRTIGTAVGTNGRSIERTILWGNTRSRALEYICQNLTRSAHTYMPTSELKAMGNVAIAATLIGLSTAASIFSRGKGGHDVAPRAARKRARARRLSSGLWILLFVFAILVSSTSRKGASGGQS